MCSQIGRTDHICQFKTYFLKIFVPVTLVILTRNSLVAVKCSKTPILEYHQMYSIIGVIYEVFKDFGLQQKIYL